MLFPTETWTERMMQAGETNINHCFITLPDHLVTPRSFIFLNSFPSTSRVSSDDERYKSYFKPVLWRKKIYKIGKKKCWDWFVWTLCSFIATVLKGLSERVFMYSPQSALMPADEYLHSFLQPQKLSLRVYRAARGGKKDAFVSSRSVDT